MKHATSIPREKLISLGTCLGKFSKTGKFRLHVTALDWISRFAQYKVSVPIPLLSISHSHPLVTQATTEYGCGFFFKNNNNNNIGLDQTQWRNAIFIRKSRGQSSSRSNHRRYTRTSRSSNLFNE